MDIAVCLLLELSLCKTQCVTTEPEHYTGGARVEWKGRSGVYHSVLQPACHLPGLY